MQGKSVTIITPFGGIPEDDDGHNKYVVLHAEHRNACKILGAKLVNGDFLDDVYPGLNTVDLRNWLAEETAGFDLVLVPLGIHHPDHIAVRKACDELEFKNMLYYSELPYATDYPEETAKLIEGLKIYSLKEKAVRSYYSQTKNGVVNRVMQKERLYENS